MRRGTRRGNRLSAPLQYPDSIPASQEERRHHGRGRAPPLPFPPRPPEGSRPPSRRAVRSAPHGGWVDTILPHGSRPRRSTMYRWAIAWDPFMGPSAPPVSFANARARKVDSGSNALRPRPRAVPAGGILLAVTAARSMSDKEGVEDHTDLNQRDRSKLAARVEFIEYRRSVIPKAAATSGRTGEGPRNRAASERGTGNGSGRSPTGMATAEPPHRATVVFRRISWFPICEISWASTPPSPGSATSAAPGDDNRGAPRSRQRKRRSERPSRQRTTRER